MSRLGSRAAIVAVRFVCLASNTTADEQLLEKSAIEAGKPTITGKGPYTVQFRGTVTLERTALKFVGTRMSFRDTNQKEAKEIPAVVNLPDANPEPGQVRVVVFTVTLPKGSYTGVAEMGFIDAGGKSRTVKFDVLRVEVP